MNFIDKETGLTIKEINVNYIDSLYSKSENEMIGKIIVLPSTLNEINGVLHNIDIKNVIVLNIKNVIFNDNLEVLRSSAFSLQEFEELVLPCSIKEMWTFLVLMTHYYFR